MPLIVTVNTIAECLWTDCNILGDNNNNKNFGENLTEKDVYGRNIPHIISSGQIMTRDQGSAGFVRGVCNSYSLVHSEVRVTTHWA